MVSDFVRRLKRQTERKDSENEKMRKVAEEERKRKIYSAELRIRNIFRKDFFPEIRKRMTEAADKGYNQIVIPSHFLVNRQTLSDIERELGKLDDPRVKVHGDWSGFGAKTKKVEEEDFGWGQLKIEILIKTIKTDPDWNGVTVSLEKKTDVTKYCQYTNYRHTYSCLIRW